MCHCGRPLHYQSASAEALVTTIVNTLGPHIVVSDSSGRRFLVPRHYIALHGLRQSELATLGFAEVTSVQSM